MFKFEPARVAGAVTAVVALLVVVGVLRAEDAPVWTMAVCGVLAVVLPGVQAEVTRARVVPMQRYINDVGMTGEVMAESVDSPTVDEMQVG